MTSASFEDLQASPVDYARRDLVYCCLVTLGVAMALWFAGHHALAVALLFLMPAAFVDSRERLLPDALTLPALGAALVINAFSGHAVEGAIGSGLGILALMLVFYLRPQRVGLGDVKLIAALGAAMGPESMMASIVLAAAFGLAIMIASPKYREHGVPMGPFFVLAALIVAILTAMVPAWRVLF